MTNAKVYQGFHDDKKFEENCRTINKLIGRSGRSRRQCPVSGNSIASQLVKMGHKTGSCESTRLINKELSDLWEVRPSEGNSISVPFRPGN